jgi:serine protease Do
MSIFMTEDLQHDLAGVATALREVTVVVRSTSRNASRASSAGQGSGIVWSPDGTIVTNAHVVTGDSALVTLADGRSAEARVALRDKRRDLAILAADTRGAAWPMPVLGAPASLKTGELVLALGHPLGVEHALAMGVVHAAPDGRRSPYVVADIQLAPGNSGGPLADARGRIVGVNSMIVGGLGFAISVDVVRSLIASAAPRPSLGVQLRPVQVRVPAGAESTSVALVVLTTATTGAAAQAGIIPGDLLLGHAGRPFHSPEDLSSLLRDAGAGGTLRLDVGRGGKQMSVEVRLGAAAEGGFARRAA